MKCIIGLLVLFLFILIIITSYFTYKIESFEGNKNKWIILLTTFVGDDESRKKMYFNSIRKWLDNTSFDIFLVESSGYSFPEFSDESRLYVYTFKQPPVKNTTHGESLSILNIIEEIKDHPKYVECTHILKVTGRYYLDGIQDVLIDADPYKDFYLQIHRYDDNKWQACEYFGIKKEFIKEFMYSITDEDVLEKKLYDFSSDKHFTTIGPFPNNVRGGGGWVYRAEL
jgi:hypothetical protein